jgi:hypothetical protein
LTAYEECRAYNKALSQNQLYWSEYYRILSPSDQSKLGPIWVTQLKKINAFRVYGTLCHLNMLGHYYGGYDGFYDSGDVEISIENLSDIENYKNIHRLGIVKFSQFYIATSMPQNILPLSHDDIFKLDDSDVDRIMLEFFNTAPAEILNQVDMGYTYMPNEAVLKELGEFPIPYRSVIIKYRKNDWYGCPIVWYNSLKVPGWLNSPRTDKLPLVSSIPYIEVITPFMEVKVSADIKGSPLTVNDILFATRPLMVDGTRNIFKYDIISENEQELVLEPDIDNFST